MCKPSQGILRSNCEKGLSYGFLQGLWSTCSHSAEKHFEFRECLFNRRQVGRIGGQKQKLAPSCFDSSSNVFSSMCIQIVQDHDLTRVQTRCQNLFNVEFKNRAIR